VDIVHPILRQWLRRPFRTFIVDDQREWTGLTLWLATQHIGRAVAQASDRERIGVYLPTSGAVAAAMAGIWSRGRTVVPLNYLLSPSELEYIIKDAELDVVVTAGPMIARFGSLPGGVKELRIEELAMRRIPRIHRATRRDDSDTAVLLYTSGTSGFPKGVMLTNRNLRSNVSQCIAKADFARNMSFLGVLPQFHSFGLTVTTLLPLTIGAKAIYTAQFKVSRVLKLLRDHRPTAFMAIPSMYNALLQSKSAKPDDFTSLKFIVSGGEPMPDAVYEGFRDRFNVRICEGYGLTETAPVTNWTLAHEERRGTVGRPLPGVEEVIVGEDGSHLPPGMDGEIRIRGDNIMAGYFKLPEATSAAFDDDGYFRTGDMGRMDEEGFLSITGRIKEMLIISGENVFPREIEEVLNRHEAVSDCAVIGQQDASRGEVPIAFVELVEGAEFDEKEVRQFCRQSLPAFKVPKAITVMDALPRNPTGKIMRRALQSEPVA
jgi:long-chain acyl-CoA synthetase